MKPTIRNRFWAATVLTAIMLLSPYAQTLLAQDAQSNVGVDDSTGNQAENPWRPLSKLDMGFLPSVAIHQSGLIVEANQKGDSVHNFGGLYYRIGRLDPSNLTVTWGPSQQFKSAAVFAGQASVAITKEGYVIITYSYSSNDLRYCVATLDLTGSINQNLNFKVFDQYYDRGYAARISVNYNGAISEVHQGGSGYNESLYYRLGHLTSPATGDFTITWDTGAGGIYYEKGQKPAVSINANGDVVELHLAPNETKIHYIRGRLSGNKIDFESTHPRFASDDVSPSVALQDDNYVLTLHIYVKKWIIGKDEYRLKYRLSKLDPDSPAYMNALSEYDLGRLVRPIAAGIATNGDHAVLVTGDDELKYSVSVAP